jgi:hypothetical protein
VNIQSGVDGAIHSSHALQSPIPRLFKLRCCDCLANIVPCGIKVPSEQVVSNPEAASDWTLCPCWEVEATTGCSSLDTRSPIALPDQTRTNSMPGIPHLDLTSSYRQEDLPEWAS